MYVQSVARLENQSILKPGNKEIGIHVISGLGEKVEKPSRGTTVKLISSNEKTYIYGKNYSQSIRKGSSVTVEKSTELKLVNNIETAENILKNSVKILIDVQLNYMKNVIPVKLEKVADYRINLLTKDYQAIWNEFGAKIMRAENEKMSCRDRLIRESMARNIGYMEAVDICLSDSKKEKTIVPMNLYNLDGSEDKFYEDYLAYVKTPAEDRLVSTTSEETPSQTSMNGLAVVNNAGEISTEKRWLVLDNNNSYNNLRHIEICGEKGIRIINNEKELILSVKNYFLSQSLSLGIPLIRVNDWMISSTVAKNGLIQTEWWKEISKELISEKKVNNILSKQSLELISKSKEVENYLKTDTKFVKNEMLETCRETEICKNDANENNSTLTTDNKNSYDRSTNLSDKIDNDYLFKETEMIELETIDLETINLDMVEKEIIKMDSDLLIGEYDHSWMESNLFDETKLSVDEELKVLVQSIYPEEVVVCNETEIVKEVDVPLVVGSYFDNLYNAADGLLAKDQSEREIMILKGINEYLDGIYNNCGQSNFESEVVAENFEAAAEGMKAIHSTNQHRLSEVQETYDKAFDQLIESHGFIKDTRDNNVIYQEREYVLDILKTDDYNYKEVGILSLKKDEEVKYGNKWGYTFGFAESRFDYENVLTFGESFKEARSFKGFKVNSSNKSDKHEIRNSKMKFELEYTTQHQGSALELERNYINDSKLLSYNVNLDKILSKRLYSNIKMDMREHNKSNPEYGYTARIEKVKGRSALELNSKERKYYGVMGEFSKEAYSREMKSTHLGGELGCYRNFGYSHGKSGKRKINEAIETDSWYNLVIPMENAHFEEVM